jgi:hypothetical protein
MGAAAHQYVLLDLAEDSKLKIVLLKFHTDGFDLPT